MLYLFLLADKHVMEVERKIMELEASVEEILQNPRHNQKPWELQEAEFRAADLEIARMDLVNVKAALKAAGSAMVSEDLAKQTKQAVTA